MDYPEKYWAVVLIALPITIAIIDKIEFSDKDEAKKEAQHPSVINNIDNSKTNIDNSKTNIDNSTTYQSSSPTYNYSYSPPNNSTNNSLGKVPKLGRKARFKALLLDKNFEQENPKKLEELTDTTCRWPIGHPYEKDFYFTIYLL